MISSSNHSYDPGTGQRIDGAMAPTRAETDWTPGPVESEDPHTDPYGGDLDLGPTPPNIVRDDTCADDSADALRARYSQLDEATRKAIASIKAHDSAPGPFSRSKQGGG